jgi:integrase
MPNSAKPPRLWERPERRDKYGRVTHASTWVILDRGRQVGTGILAIDNLAGEQALENYIREKRTGIISRTQRATETIPVSDVLALYFRDVIPGHADKRQTAYSIRRLGEFFGHKYLSEVNAGLCRQYAATSASEATARVDLTYLRASINHHLKEGLHTSIVSVWMPDKPAARERWATRSEIAKLLWQTWRHKDGAGQRRRQHIARFILVAVYTGTRSGTINRTMLKRTVGRPYIDVESGVYHRRPERAAETAKRRPAIQLPPSLLAHVRRWHRAGINSITEYAGADIASVAIGYRHAVSELGMGDLVPHCLRHTAATWLMQAGVDPWQAAGYLGMTVKMLTDVYGHHHPDHLKGVHGAFSKHRSANASQ